MTTKPEGTLTTWTQTGTAPSLWEGEGPTSHWLVWEVPESDVALNGGAERPNPVALIRWDKSINGPTALPVMYTGPSDAMDGAESMERGWAPVHDD
jgi:hypothetical protein